MKITALPSNLEYVIPEIQCYQVNLRQRRLAALATLLPGAPTTARRSARRMVAVPTSLLPQPSRPFLVLSSTYRIN